MAKTTHEMRDPVHGFIRLDDDERSVIDSAPVQRLRQIHQLAMSYLVYPGATHRRFEHSLGVMELATRVFDVITNQENVLPQINGLMPDLQRKDGLAYWRRVLRMAALCHDLGHLPFSHAAEHDLLPTGWDHERLTVEIIRSDVMEELWASMTPPLRASDVAKIAVGQKKLKGESYTDWQAILSEIVVGDAFGVDRMDYLLRDSLHAGVAYGRFDHFRLIDTIRILPASPVESGGSKEPELGIESGGLHSAEALLLARYFMFSQVYFHPVRRIYDIHLKDFLRDWLDGKTFPTDVVSHIDHTDTEVISAMADASRDPDRPGHDSANRILGRRHFKVLWERNPSDLNVNPDAGTAIEAAANAKFGEHSVRRDSHVPSSALIDFPVLLRDGRIVSAQAESDVLKNVPTAAFDYVFVRPDLLPSASKWLEEERSSIVSKVVGEEIDHGTP